MTQAEILEAFASTALAHISGDDPHRDDKLAARLTRQAALGDALSATADGRAALEQAAAHALKAQLRFSAARVVETWNLPLAIDTYVSVIAKDHGEPIRPMTLERAWLYQGGPEQAVFAAAARLTVLDEPQ